MKKKLLSLLLTLCLLCPSLTVSAAASFTDITDPDTALAAGVLHSMGIVGGVGDGLYSPDTVLTRAQFCVFIIHTLGMKDLVNSHAYKTLFTDVKPGNWYTGYVNLAYDQDLLAGYGNGKFGPDDPVTYGQAATLLLRILGYTSADVGKIWPVDYVNYAHTLELDEGLTLSADKGVTRGEAAILLYNTLNTETKGSKEKYYKTFDDTASVQKGIVLDVNAQNGTATGQLMACVVTTAGASIEYFSQKNLTSPVLVGYEGDLLLNASGKVLGFVPGSTDMKDVVIATAKASGITDSAGITHRITGSTVTIVGDDIYTWSNTGYLRVDALSGRTARLFYDEDGAISYVYVSTGITDANTSVAIALTDTADAELARKLGVTGPYLISKNGSSAKSGDLAKYDVAYFDAASRTLCVSDRRISGYVEGASPALDGAQNITISGCTIPVLESAWDTLGQYRLGDKLTLLLTDDNKVAAAFPASQVSADMLGILSLDGTSVTLYGSGLVITADEVEADERLRGTLVRVGVYDDSLTCFSYSSNLSGTLDIARGTVGNYALAPACSIFEHAGGNLSGGYVYSLSGEIGVPSTDFEDIFWTSTISSDNVDEIHLNSAGQVDLILLKNVTGNCYSYGKLTRYTGFDGIMTSAAPQPTYNNAATLTNGSGQSQKYLSSYAVGYNKYFGIALRSYSTQYQEVISLVELTDSDKLDAASFSLREDDWFATVSGHEIPVSEQVQVYVKSTDRWLSGPEGVKTAVSSDLPLTIHYDKTLTSGAVVRVIVVEEQG